MRRPDPPNPSRPRQRQIVRRSVFALILFQTAACALPSTSPSPATSETAKEAGPVATEKNLRTVVIVGTNDFHGALAPIHLKTRDPEPVDYRSGGMTYFASYLKALRADLGSRLIWLDAGDEYQGTIDSNVNHGALMVSVMNNLGLTAAAVGNHEFDFGAEAPDTGDKLSALKHRMTEARFHYLAANIYRAGTSELAPFPNTLPSEIVDADGLKVGIIGLSTRDTPRTTRPENIVSLRFGSLRKATLREADRLRQQGAQIVVVTAHSGLFCATGRAPTSDVLRKPDEPQGSCDGGDEMTRLLKSLPRGTVDAVVSGHTHTIVHHWVNGVPVIQGGSFGRYFNVIYLTYDLSAGKVLPDHTRIQGPVPVCPRVFQNQGDCNGDRPAPREGRGPLIVPVFHNQKIKADRDTIQLLKPTFDADRKIKREVFGNAARAVEHFRSRESPLGDLVADSIRKASQADVALVNAGGIRADLEQGPITYGEIFRILPFENSVEVLDLTGRQLRTLLRVAESGSRGFPPVSGLRLRLVDPESDAPSTDLNEDGKIEPWEVNRLLEVRMDDGTLLDDNKHYKLATLDYLASGGDDFGWVMSQIPEEDKKPTGILVRDAFAKHVQELSRLEGSINTPAYPAADPAHPRLVFVRVKQPASHARSRRRRWRHRRRRHRRRRATSS